ncbi:NTP transferase domain-containing protein [Aeromicrobium sp. CF4.19]|uniref:nucleotidyltransferase family protein n=1 Tax=Aeromicrobium sp. CF4.19 TaxID=3373082 RepID=UPI003EE6170C
MDASEEPEGLLLAAGRGSRMGRPKALMATDDVSWVARAAEVLREGGCGRVTVVLGAAAEEARGLVPAGVTVVVAADFATGLSASLRTGLEALSAGDATSALVHLVDLPDVTPAVARRVLQAGAAAGSLARATYAGRPGHPVLIGRDHWSPVLDSLSGDEGARGYLQSADVGLIECGDLAGGEDVDRPGGRRNRC